ncbi:unnamed protein product, partial [Prorocentrum cordatum]
HRVPGAATAGPVVPQGLRLPLPALQRGGRCGGPGPRAALRFLPGRLFAALVFPPRQRRFRLPRRPMRRRARARGGELRELQASAEMMFLLLNERQRESAALLEPLRQRLAELPECHWACQGLRLLDLSTEGRQLAGGGGAAPQAAQQERAAPWAQGALRADDWLREARGDGHGLMSFRLAPLVLELAAAGFADLLGGELLGRARAAAALERVIYGDDDGDNGGRGAG